MLVEDYLYHHLSMIVNTVNARILENGLYQLVSVDNNGDVKQLEFPMGSIVRGKVRNLSLNGIMSPVLVAVAV